MNKLLYFFLPSFFFLLFSCSDATTQENTTNHHSNDEKADSGYMRTGFYFLTEADDGVKMKMKDSDAVFSLEKTPFASVDNIKETKLTTTKLEQGDYTELCMTFDEQGTKDLAEGTGNGMHPKLAVVIAGQLLYVIDNTVKIRTGVMCVGLINYTTEEMLIIKQEVDQKK